jgi:hypothetical protein
MPYKLKIYKALLFLDSNSLYGLNLNHKRHKEHKRVEKTKKNPGGIFLRLGFCVLLVRREAYIDPAGERPAWSNSLFTPKQPGCVWR